jgi:predicted nucleic acid-binding protein
MILDLTYYEVGNSIWKGTELTKSLSKAETKELTEAIAKTLSALRRIEPSVDDFSSILDMAVDKKLTFYDASYVCLAKKNALTLVTHDGRLSRIAKKYVKAVSLADIADKGNKANYDLGS